MDPQTKAPLTPEAIAFATRMFDAARAGQMDIFQQALPAGLPATMTNEKGDSLVSFPCLWATNSPPSTSPQSAQLKVEPTQIMLAAYYGHPALVTLLIQHGADPNTLNDKGQSPLAGAVFKNEKDVIEALLAGGADPEAGTPSALDAIGIFKKEEWREKFENAVGRGKANSAVL
jgi:ankyrin repeat protein